MKILRIQCFHLNSPISSSNNSGFVIHYIDQAGLEFDVPAPMTLLRCSNTCSEDEVKGTAPVVSDLL